MRKRNALTPHSHTPSWYNGQLCKLLTIPDPIIWAVHGIVYLYQVLTPTGPKTVQMSKDEYSLPNHPLFR